MKKTKKRKKNGFFKNKKDNNETEIQEIDKELDKELGEERVEAQRKGIRANSEGEEGVLYRARKIRFYPTKEQRELLNKWFGGNRFIYNQLVANVGNELVIRQLLKKCATLLNR